MRVSITYRQQDESDSLAGRLNDDLYRLTMDFPTLFCGEKVSIFVADYANIAAHACSCVEAEDGDVVNDSIYKKNEKIKEVLNVDLDFIEFHHDWSDHSQMYDAIRIPIMGNFSLA